MYANLGSYTITVIVTDNQGASDTKSTTVTVNNTPPILGSITLSTNPIQINTTTTATANFTDSGVLNTHTASWNWGDGTTSIGTVTESNGNGSVSKEHIYTASGVYTITLTLTDNHGGSATSTYEFVSVYDAAAGWVSGSKEFTSPIGAVTGNASATGKANFGFQAKYQNAAMTPSGTNVEFTLDSANIDYQSTGYLWLVVSGNKATLIS